MSEYIADTIGLVLFLEKRRSGEAAKKLFAATEAGDAFIYIPAMVIAEVLYLSERQRISATLRDVVSLLEQDKSLQDLPISLFTLQAAAEITDIPELHDRLIAGAARSLGLPLITNDQQIASSEFVTAIW